jgi:hypothetical protein
MLTYKKSIFAVPDYGLGRTDNSDYEDYSQYQDFNELSDYIGEDTVMLVFELTNVFSVVCAQTRGLKSVNCYYGKNTGCR